MISKIKNGGALKIVSRKLYRIVIWFQLFSILVFLNLCLGTQILEPFEGYWGKMLKSVSRVGPGRESAHECNLVLIMAKVPQRHHKISCINYMKSLSKCLYPMFLSRFIKFGTQCYCCPWLLMPLSAGLIALTLSKGFLSTPKHGACQCPYKARGVKKACKEEHSFKLDLL